MPQHLHFAAGQIVFRQAYPGDHAYIVVSGEIEIYRETEAGESHVAMLGPGQMFGELAILDDQPRSASARATQPTVLQIVDL